MTDFKVNSDSVSDITVCLLFRIYDEVLLGYFFLTYIHTIIFTKCFDVPCIYFTHCDH